MLFKITFQKLKYSLIFISLFSYSVFSQENDSTKHLLNLRTSLSVTNNGFSFIPSFSLGKPATILNVSIIGKKFSFEPEFRFSLAGKPWSFIFIYRYKLVNNKKFQLVVGGHVPAITFRTVPVIKNGVTQNLIQSQRFLASELVSNYIFNKNSSIGFIFLKGHGFEKDGARDTHFLAFKANFMNILPSSKYFLRATPQVFFLNVDKKNGYYFSSSFNVGKYNFPLSISSTINKQLKTNIPGKNFDWNLSLNYSTNSFFKRI
jgi:hypothetical protein